MAGLASEGLALISGSAGEGSSAVLGSTPTDPVEFRKCARDLKTLSAARKYTNEERGGSRDAGVRRPGAGRGQLPARSKIFVGPAFLGLVGAPFFLCRQFCFKVYTHTPKKKCVVRECVIK